MFDIWGALSVCDAPGRAPRRVKIPGSCAPENTNSMHDHVFVVESTSLRGLRGRPKALPATPHHPRPYGDMPPEGRRPQLLFPPTWFAWMGVFADSLRDQGTGRCRHQSVSPALVLARLGNAAAQLPLRGQPRRKALRSYPPGQVRRKEKHPHPSPLRSRPYAGGILIHLRFGQNTAHAHLFFHLSLNNAMDTLCVETVVSTCLARDCPPAVCLAHC